MPDHVPVLTGAVVRLLAPVPGGVVVDATVGSGGHAAAILDASSPDGRLVGIDRDPAALTASAARLSRFGERFALLRGNFSDLPPLLAGVAPVDGVLLDLGVSSPQLDDPARGFSFTRPGPLDMRMDPESGETASDLVNRLPETALADLIFELGEERYARRIARRIVAVRGQNPLKDTAVLADIVAGAVPRRGRIHPATRTFQALRMAVNGEMEHLKEALEALPRVLRAGGRAVVIGFHSLEDRQVKQAFRALARRGLCEILTAKPLTADREERSANPRSRSAKLRAIRMRGE